MPYRVFSPTKLRFSRQDTSICFSTSLIGFQVSLQSVKNLPKNNKHASCGKKNRLWSNWRMQTFQALCIRVWCHWTQSYTCICFLGIIACNCLEIGFYHKGICSRNCPFKQSFFFKATIIPTMLEGIRKPITSIEFLDWKSIHNINLYPLSWGQGKTQRFSHPLPSWWEIDLWKKYSSEFYLRSLKKWWGVRRRRKKILCSVAATVSFLILGDPSGHLRDFIILT